MVTRAEKVRVKAMGLNGKIYRLNAEDLLAQALEHEIDHLNGILYIDHLVDKDSLQKITYGQDPQEDEFDGEESDDEEFEDELEHDSEIEDNVELDEAVAAELAAAKKED
jgi:hypothetical protein